jgi:hypothetical protein
MNELREQTEGRQKEENKKEMKLHMVHLQFNVHVHCELIISKEYYVLGYNAMKSTELTSQGNISPPPS